MLYLAQLLHKNQDKVQRGRKQKKMGQTVVSTCNLHLDDVPKDIKGGTPGLRSI